MVFSGIGGASFGIEVLRPARIRQKQLDRNKTRCEPAEARLRESPSYAAALSCGGRDGLPDLILDRDNLLHHFAAGVLPPR
jgi:hypothetical protein